MSKGKREGDDLADTSKNTVSGRGQGVSTVTKTNYILWLLVVFIAIILVYLLYIRIAEVFGIGENRVKNIPIIYTSSDKLLYKNQLMDKSEVVDADLSWGINSNMKNSTRLSSDGTALLYLNNTNSNSGTLYSKAVYKNIFMYGENNFSGTKIADNVLHSSFHFLSDNKSAVYLTTDGALHSYNGKTTTELDKNVKKLLSVDYANNVYYLSGDDSSVLKTISPASGTEAKTISENIKRIYKIADDGTVIYFFSDADGTQSLAKYDHNAEVILAKNCDTVLQIADNGNVFFVRKVKNIFDTTNVFLDKHKVLDEHLKEPNKNDFMDSHTGLFGDVSASFNEEEYNLAVKQYEEKLERDSIRAGIEKDIRVVDSNELVLRTSHNETVIQGDISSVLGVDADRGYVAYENLVFDSKNKYDISDLETPEQGYELILKELNDENNYKKVIRVWSAATRDTHILDKKNIERVYFTNNPEIYALDNESNLMYMSENGENKNNITDGVRYFDTNLKRDIGIRLSDSSYELFKMEQDKYHTLYTSNTPLVVKGIYDKALLIYSNYNDFSSTGDLIIYTDKTENISDNVYSYSVRTDNMIYILKNYNSVDGGELYVYSNGTMTQIDTGVRDILTSKKWGFGT